jgi:SNF2 family DNA or RNA helicase
MAVLASPATPSASGGLPPIGAHQDRAINECLDRDSLLVEYGTGTGKSRIYIELIEAILAAGEVPALVLVPNSLMEQTFEEFVKWLGYDWCLKRIAVLNGGFTIDERRHHLRFGKQAVFLLSHEAMSYPLIREALSSRKWAVVVLDEASRFRNYSNRTKALTRLTARASSRYIFTGNLAPRSPADVWYVMNFLSPGLFGTRNIQTFKTTYCLMGGFENREVIGLRPDKAAEFRDIMDAHRITCQLSDIRDLPERVLHVPRVTMPSKAREAYKELQETLRLEIERVDDVTFQSMVKTYATRLQRLQEITAGFARNIEGDVVGLPCAKTTAMLDLLEDEPDRPTVLWAWWRPEIATITANLRKKKIPYVLFGEPGAVDTFMSGGVNVLVSQLAKGGYGLNLTRATRMIYHSLCWSLDVYLQSMDRNMRLTTTADHLEVVHLTTRDSVDEYVRNKLVNRADLSSQLTRSTALELLKGSK